MARKVTRSVIDEVVSLLLEGRIKYMTIYSVNSKKSTRFNIDYQLFPETVTEEITPRHKQAVETLYNFIQALEEGNVTQFSFNKKGLSITFITLFKDRTPKQNAKILLSETRDILALSNLNDLYVNIDDKKVNIIEVINSIESTLNKTRK